MKDREGEESAKKSFSPWTKQQDESMSGTQNVFITIDIKMIPEHSIVLPKHRAFFGLI